MLVTIKTLKQETFKIDIDPESSILELKKKIEERNGPEYSVSCQKLIYSGKILEDSENIGCYEIKEDRFVVVTAQKPSAQPVVQPVIKAETPKGSEKMDVSKPLSIETQISAPVVQAENSLAIGEKLETDIKELMSMGFPRDKVLKAMRAGSNNADRAAEYLLSGSIPDVDEEAQVSQSDETAGDHDQQNDEDQDYIQVTPEEREAIDRLMALGFSEDLCVEAYFTCGKNEEIAANLLFEQDDDQWEQ